MCAHYACIVRTPPQDFFNHHKQFLPVHVSHISDSNYSSVKQMLRNLGHFFRRIFHHRSCGHPFYDLFAKLLKHRRHARNLLACTDRTRKGGQCIVVLLPFWDQFCCYLRNHGTSRGSILRNRQFSKTLLFATTEILDSFSNTFYQCRFVQIVENKTTRDTYE